MCSPRRHGRWTDPRLVTVGLLVAALVPRLSGRPRTPPLGLDKLAHAVAHALFVYSLLESVDAATDRGAVPAAVGLSVAYAFLLEGLQRYVPGRQYETGDVVASVVGSVVGVFLVRRRDEP